MPLPASAPITLLQIQNEYGVSGLAAAAVAGIPGTSLSGTNLTPDRSMLDFLGRSNYALNLNVKPISVYWTFNNTGSIGNITQSFMQLIFNNNGVQEWLEGDNSQYWPTNYETDHWIDSVPNGGNRASVTSNYDFEWEFVQGDTDNYQTTDGVLGITKEWTHSISPAFGVRVNMGSNSPILVRQVYLMSNGNNASISSFIQVRSKIYQAGTNNLLSNVLHAVILQADYGPPL